jgi:hypothetical protein
MRGDTDDDGTRRQPRDGLFTWVTVKDEGAWKIRASHNMNKTEVRERRSAAPRPRRT